MAGNELTSPTQEFPTSGAKGYLAALRDKLKTYRPRWRDRRFWILQALVIFLASLHVAVDSLGLGFDVLYFLPVSLLMIPVVYAALTYGSVGAVATTLWVITLSIPGEVLLHHGLQRIGIISELVLLGGVAALIGGRVDLERRLRKQTENTAAALKASTTKYQGLLESNPIAVIVMSPVGLISEVNPAATILFGKERSILEGAQLSNLFPASTTEELLNNARRAHQTRDTLTLERNGRAILLEPRLTETQDGKGHPVIQLLLRDVTEEYERRAGLRAYAAEVLRILEEDRQLMARELHDETIQTLIILCRQLGDALDDTTLLPPETVEKLREAEGTAIEAVKELRNFVRTLRPPTLDDLGITPSIRRLLADFKERTKIEGRLTVNGNEHRLPPDTELGIFRIAQEALRNVERHAEANYVSVSLSFTEHGITLGVVDNGIGFLLPSASSDFTTSGRLGLISMQERAQLMHGNLEILSSPGNGTKVTVVIPNAYDVVQVAHRLNI